MRRLDNRFKPPVFCDHYCRYASFTKEDLSGACRKEQAIYCNLTKKHNNKNNKCLYKKDK